MKKTLLFAALAFVAVSASADYKEYYTVSFNGKEVANGEMVTVSAPQTTADGKANYEAVIEVQVNKGDEEVPTYMAGSYDYYRPAESACVGLAQFCSDTNCYPASTAIPGNIGYRDCDPDFDYYAGDSFSYLIHMSDVPTDKADFDQVYKVWMGAYEGEVADVYGNYNFTPVENGQFVMYLQFCLPEFASVDGLEAEDAAPVYYNLQGVQIERPESGLVIVKKGNKVTKTIIRK